MPMITTEEQHKQESKYLENTGEAVAFTTIKYVITRTQCSHYQKKRP